MKRIFTYLTQRKYPACFVWILGFIAILPVHLFAQKADDVTLAKSGIVNVYHKDSRMTYGISFTSQLMRSTDGGKTWDISPLPVTTLVYDITFSDVSTGFIVGQGGLVLRSRDGGSSWQKTNSPVSTDLKSVSFADASYGVIVGKSGTILLTNSGGETWQKLDNITDVDLYRVFFSDKNKGFILGNKDVILETSDSGKTWTSQK